MSSNREERRWCPMAFLTFLFGTVLGAAAYHYWIRSESAERRPSDHDEQVLMEHHVTGLIDNVRLIREIREGRGDALADRLSREVEDYVHVIPQNNRWTPYAFSVARGYWDETNAVLPLPTQRTLAMPLPPASPAAILRDNVVYVFPPGVSFEVPPRWQFWALEHGHNIYTPGHDLDQAVHGEGEWNTEYAAIVNALLPSNSLLFHGGGGSWGKPGGGTGLQVRFYSALEPNGDDVEARVAAVFPTARVELKTVDEWKVTGIAFDVAYGDYFGTGRIDIYVKDIGDRAGALVFMRSGEHEEEAIRRILETFRTYPQRAASSAPPKP